MKQLFKKLAPLTAVPAMALIAHTLWKVDFKSIIVALSSLPLTLIAWLIALQVLTQILLNLQWYRLSKVAGGETFFWKMLVVNSYGAIADAITPGEKVGGEALKVVQLNRKFGYTTKKSVILVTIQKALSLSSLIILNLIVVLPMADGVVFLRPFPVRAAMLAILIFAAVFLFFLLIKTELFALLVNKINTKKRWLAKFISWVTALPNIQKS